MNNNLSKLLKQLADIWGQLGASQRMTVAAATFVLVAGMVAAGLWSSHADYGLLYGGLSDAEAAKVIAALDDAKVPYKAGSGGAILVPTDKVYAMRMQLASKGIPQGDGVGFEIFDKPNFGISDFVQRANYLRAVQGELARTISQIDDVQAARVMIVLPENRLLLDKDKFPTASVFVRVRGNSQLSSQTINSIRFLVANSVEGLKANHVAVVDNLGNAEEIADNDSLAGMSSSQLAARRNMEQYLAKKAQDMLEKVLGPGQAIVRVSADINLRHRHHHPRKIRSGRPGGANPDQERREQRHDHRARHHSRRHQRQHGQRDERRHGFRVAREQLAKTTKPLSTIEYEVGKTTSSHHESAGGIKRLTAAVTVAQQMEGTGAERKPVARTPEDLDKLRSIVSNAVGADLTRGDTIDLAELPFNDHSPRT